MPDFDPIEQWPFKDEDLHFCSGVNAPGEVRGLALSGQSVGLVADKVSANVLDELSNYRCGPLRVFVDSGAFGEVRFGPAGREVVNPITDDDWNERFEVYRRACEAIGPHNVYLVAPDAVGDQAETLVRLRKYAPAVRSLHDLGANIVVAMQRGELDAVEFVRAVFGAIGFADFIVGIPSKKSATTPEVLGDDCQALYAAGFDGARFHLLGMGPSSRRWDEQREAIRAWFPEALIYSDAVGSRREAGRTNGPGGGPRRLTLAQDEARARGATGSEVKAQAIAALGHEDCRRQAQAARRAGWFDPELESAPGVPLSDGCIEYGPGGPFGVAHTNPQPQGELFDEPALALG